MRSRALCGCFAVCSVFPLSDFQGLVRPAKKLLSARDLPIHRFRRCVTRVARNTYPSWPPDGRSHSKSTVSPSKSSLNSPPDITTSPGCSGTRSSGQRCEKWVQHPPRVSGDAITPQPSSLCQTCTTPTEVIARVWMADRSCARGVPGLDGKQRPSDPLLLQVPNRPPLCRL